VVDALNELRQWREGTSAKARALGVALAAAPGLSAAIAAELSAADAGTVTTGKRAGDGTSTGAELPDALQRSFDAVLGETGRVLQLAEHQVAATVQRVALSARQLGERGYSSTPHWCHALVPYAALLP
jgi:hypothetical protein